MGLTVIWNQSQKSEMNPILMVGRNKSALALPSNQEIFTGQLINGLANRALTDLVAKSFSLGMASPGFHSPACKLPSIRALIC
jgi:hypothetical protein